ncbi:unnamed protein product [Malus baccata var. baccata]
MDTVFIDTDSDEENNQKEDPIIDIESDEENNREEDPVIVNRTKNFDDIFVGKVVLNEKEAYDLYNNYATTFGFSVRKGQKRYNRKNQLRQVCYLCSKEGFKVDVAQFFSQHNHELAKPEERQFLRSNRKVSEAQLGVIKTMAAAGIRTTNTYSYLAEEAGGSQNVGFTQRDCYNVVNKEKMVMFEAGDAQSLINLFKHKQAEDHMFFYTVQVDQENRMTNFFWRDGRSRLDYECFGDVVVFDTTYRTNRYNMICAPFVGVNHHWKNVLFGCAFLLDEKTETFTWLFDTFLESMGGQKPKTIFTDQCQAMANGIEKVFSGVCHRLCSWHISQNCAKNMSSLYANPDFRRLFNKCLKYFAEVNLTGCSRMCSRMNMLYALRAKWCPAFSHDTFTCRIQSSQRSESTNNVFHQISTKTMRLIEFVHHYDKQAVKMRTSESEESYRCNQGLPSRVAQRSGILKHAATVYTRKMFKIFEKEFLNSLAVTMHEYESCGTIHSFELNEEDGTVSCSCKMYESMCLLCRHALRVLNVKSWTEIPSQHILKRWTKDAKKGLHANEHSQLLQVKGEPSVTLRRNALMRMAYNILSKGAESKSATRVAMKKLGEMEELIEKDMIKSKGEVNKESNDNNDDDCNANGCSVDEPPILNPPLVRPKGISNARLKSAMEKREKKRHLKILSHLVRKTKKPSNIGPSHSSTPYDSNFLQQLSVPTSTNVTQVYPTMSLLTTNSHALPPSNQVEDDMFWVGNL